MLYLEFQESTLAHSNPFKTQFCKSSSHSSRHVSAFRGQLRCTDCAGSGSVNYLEDRLLYQGQGLRLHDKMQNSGGWGTKDCLSRADITDAPGSSNPLRRGASVAVLSLLVTWGKTMRSRKPGWCGSHSDVVSRSEWKEPSWELCRGKDLLERPLGKAFNFLLWQEGWLISFLVTNIVSKSQIYL